MVVKWWICTSPSNSALLVFVIAAVILYTNKARPSSSIDKGWIHQRRTHEQKCTSLHLHHGIIALYVQEKNQEHATQTEYLSVFQLHVELSALSLTHACM